MNLSAMPYQQCNTNIQKPPDFHKPSGEILSIMCLTTLVGANVVKNPDYAISSEASRSMSSAVILMVPTSPSIRVSQLSGSCASIVPSP